MKTPKSSSGLRKRPAPAPPSTDPASPKTIRHPALPVPLLIPPDDGRFTHDELTTLYWSNHPRFHFLKMSPANARFFDIGAGWGRLSFWRDWLQPLRRDLELHGCDLNPAKFADQYAAFHVMDIDGARFPYADGFFGAAISSHVIEHLRRQDLLAAELHRVLAPGAMVYVETPTEESQRFPNRDFFLANGCPSTTVNFADDRTHTAAVGRKALHELFLGAGFTELEAGTIKMPYLEEALLAKAVAENDQELGSYGLWSKLGFAHYAVFQKPLA
jgi:SAM-dependent methyltransferase